MKSDLRALQEEIVLLKTKNSVLEVEWGFISNIYLSIRKKQENMRKS